MMLSPTRIAKAARRQGVEARLPASRWGLEESRLQLLLSAAARAALSMEGPSAPLDDLHAALPRPKRRPGHLRAKSHLLENDTIVLLSYIVRSADLERLTAEHLSRRAEKERAELDEARKQRDLRTSLAKRIAEERRSRAPQRTPYLKREKNGYWYIRWSVARRSHRATTGFKDKVQAGLALQRWIASQPPLKRRRATVHPNKLVKRSNGDWCVLWTEDRVSRCFNPETKNRGEARRLFASWRRAQAGSQAKISVSVCALTSRGAGS